MPNNYPVNNPSNACGTTSKCGGCVYKLICDRSPYCRIKNNSTNLDLSPVTNELTQFESAMGKELKTISANMNTVGSNLNVLNNNINNIGTAISEINTKLDEILSKLSSSKVELDDTVQSVDAEEVTEDEQGIVPFTNASDDTVLVQKKNIFGKTKWVEEKK
jgi:archaellum component FlaC